MVSACFRTVGYACLGDTGEVLYTAGKALVNHGHMGLHGFTQLWVIPLYGLGGAFAFEKIHKKLKNEPILLRVTAYAAMCFAIEYAGGWAAEKITGECPWKYEGPYSVHGYINLTHFPVWGALCLIGEKVDDLFQRLEIAEKS